jgi:hypothetical protein
MTSQPGIGAMLHYLGGGSKEDPKSFYGRTITAAELRDDKFHLSFDDGQKIAIWDDGQSCCEHRYMKCDDDPASLVGHKLTRIEAKEGPDVQGDYDTHEQVFVEIGTDAGFITLNNHNEHNGYYGGFGLTITKDS